MAVSAEYREFVCDVLAAVGPVSIRSMFGGAGVYLDGVMFGLIADETLFFKVDDSNRERFEEEGCLPFTYEGKNKPIVMQYWQVPEWLFDEPEEMAEWARLSFDIALKSKQQKRGARKGSGKAVKKP